MKSVDKPLKTKGIWHFPGDDPLLHACEVPQGTAYNLRVLLLNHDIPRIDSLSKQTDGETGQGRDPRSPLKAWQLHFISAIALGLPNRRIR